MTGLAIMRAAGRFDVLSASFTASASSEVELLTEMSPAIKNVSLASGPDST